MTQAREGPPGLVHILTHPSLHSLDCARRDFWGEHMYTAYSAPGDPYLRPTHPQCTQVQAGAGNVMMFVLFGVAGFVTVSRLLRGWGDEGPVLGFMVASAVALAVAGLGTLVTLFVTNTFVPVLVTLLALPALFALYYAVRFRALGTPLAALGRWLKGRAARKNDRLLKTAQAVQQLRQDPEYEAAMAELDRLMGGV